MPTFQDYLNSIVNVKFTEINAAYKNQFKLKETMLNAASRNFESIFNKFLLEGSAGAKRKWDKQCKLFFVWFLIKYFQSKSQRIINPTPEEWEYFESVLKIDKEILKGRWITLIVQQTKSISWNAEEDEIIKKLMSDKDEKHIWTQIAVELYNYNNGQFVRTPKQVRERWMNYLNPSLKKDDWTVQEDNALLAMVVQVGKRWSHIAQLIDGRTENQVKNKYKSLINRILKNEEMDDVDEIKAIQEYLNQKQQDQVPPELKPKQSEQTRPRLKREAKEKQCHQLKLQKETEDLVDKIIEKADDSAVQQKSVKKVKSQPSQDVKPEQKPPTEINNAEQMILLGLSNYGGCDTTSLENRTPISNLSLHQQNINDFLRQYQNRIPCLGSALMEPSRDLKSSRDLTKDQTKGFRPYQGDKSPIQMMQESHQLFAQMMQGTGTPLQQYTPSDLLKHWQQKQIQQFGISPMGSMMSGFQQNGMFYATPLQTFSQQQYLLPSPSNMIIKSPYRVAQDISPYLQQDYQPQLATPTPRPYEQPQTPQSVAMNHQMPMQLHQLRQMEPQEPEPSFDFLKEGNIINRWKTKRTVPVEEKK